MQVQFLLFKKVTTFVLLFWIFLCSDALSKYLIRANFAIYSLM